MKVTALKNHLSDSEILTLLSYSEYPCSRQKLINIAERYKSNPEIYAFGCEHSETDNDAVEFYQKNGFLVERLKEKYVGTPRYLCTLHLN